MFRNLRTLRQAAVAACVLVGWAGKFGFGYGDGRCHALADARRAVFAGENKRRRRETSSFPAGDRPRMGPIQLWSARCRSAAWTRDLDRRVDLVDDDGDQRRREAPMPNSSDGQIARADRSTC